MFVGISKENRIIISFVSYNYVHIQVLANVQV